MSLIFHVCRRQLCSGVVQYEVREAQDAARAVMPLARLRAEVADAAQLSRDMGDAAPLADNDALVVAMLGWFKTEFFTWVGPTALLALGGPESCALLQAIFGSLARVKNPVRPRGSTCR